MCSDDKIECIDLTEDEARVILSWEFGIDRSDASISQILQPVMYNVTPLMDSLVVKGIAENLFPTTEYRGTEKWRLLFVDKKALQDAKFHIEIRRDVGLSFPRFLLASATPPPTDDS